MRDLNEQTEMFNIANVKCRNSHFENVRNQKDFVANINVSRMLRSSHKSTSIDYTILS